MITIRRAEARHHRRRGKQDVWFTFPCDSLTPPARGFGALEQMEEGRMDAGAGGARRSLRDTDVLTYVREGALAREHAVGDAGLLRAGEFELLTAGRGIGHRDTNGSATDAAHVFRLFVRPADTGLAPTRQRKRFFSANRRGLLCVVASPDARSGSLLVHQDAFLYSAILAPGQHVVHQLMDRRCAWLHVVHGHVTLDEMFLTAGDGVGITAERAVALTALEPSELLLLDLENEGPLP